MLDGGGYYYDPVHHGLVALGPGTLEGVSYTPANRHVVARAAFGLVLVAELAAIRPLYGDLSHDFTLIEAGLISQVLEETAASIGLGLCQMAILDSVPMRAACGLAEGHRILHSLVGGVIAAGPFTEA
jgi:hypothetical protein